MFNNILNVEILKQKMKLNNLFWEGHESLKPDLTGETKNLCCGYQYFLKLPFFMGEL
jgi:hypothetical protein